MTFKLWSQQVGLLSSDDLVESLLSLLCEFMSIYKVAVSLAELLAAWELRT